MSARARARYPVRMEVLWDSSKLIHSLKKDLPRDVKDSIIHAANRTAEVALPIAKKYCPVGTPESTGIPGYIGGSLKKSTRLERRAKPKGKTYYVGLRAGGYVTNPNTGKKVDYALAVHEGTSRMPPRPFIRLALRQAGRLTKKFFWEEMTGVGI